ncbi:hypothetical protein ACMU_18385 [Actibacterium mucosum KCTC 23349]|uniref:Sulfatase N-terminal domain-containing protein n=1 Tax=Actibacterium mucosum KCTC 23349 TaxID=1454373 RepID=A0A037ZFX1_9RHOB|nr:sulfatase [Actibacterium mucosum]KAJ54396.1 hypothetical protein ACMU_18385 [Actibacterium mucosum KCTC 23349]
MNILLIHTHDTGRYVSAYGYPAPTPNLQRFAETGVTYRRAFSAAPTCSPSRVALMTGCHPHQSGMWGLAHRGSRMTDPGQHLSHALHATGYHTALIGVQHEVAASEIESLGYEHVQTELGQNSFAIAEAAAKWLTRAPSDRPFFASVGFFDTHRPYLSEVSAGIDARWLRPPEPFPDTDPMRADMARFYTGLAEVDRGVGQILATLDARGLSDNTMVIITTDHGIAWPGMKGRLTDHGTGVMLMVRAPGVDGGSVKDDLVCQTDIFPTICALLNLETPERCGAHLLPGLGLSTPSRTHVFAQTNIHASIEVGRSIRTDRYRYTERLHGGDHWHMANIDPSPPRDMLVQNGVATQPAAQSAFYDLAADPLEANPIAPDHQPAEAAALKAQLDAWRTETADPLLDPAFTWPAGMALTDPTSENPAQIVAST